MMLPSYVIYDELKGQSEKRIRNKIKRIKAEISRLKKEIERPDFSSERVCPSPETQLKMNFEYLDAAKRALSDSGYEYIPTRKERKAAEFTEKIECITEMFFTYGGFFHGYDKYGIFIVGDKAEIKPIDVFPLAEDNTLIRFCEKKEITEKLYALRMGEWKSFYRPPYPILDGYQWDLEIKYDDGKKKTFAGSNACPYNFDELLEIFGIKDEEESENESE